MLRGVLLLLEVFMVSPAFSSQPTYLLGVMGLGWCFDIYLLRHRSDPRALTLKLIGVGVLAHILWLLVRWLNAYVTHPHLATICSGVGSPV